jgi:hypothetical protein
MALYRYEQFIAKAKEHKEFDTLYNPGTKTSWSGIYRCEGVRQGGRSHAGSFSAATKSPSTYGISRHHQMAFGSDRSTSIALGL